jgi:broad specificity phosphatase PhoE
MEEAEQAALHLAAWRALWPPLEAIYSSPLRRARETASVLAKVLDVQVEEIGDLADTDAGEWAGQELKQLAKRPEWATVMHHPSGFCFPGGEALVAMAARAVATARAIAAKHPGKVAVAVSHADPIKAVLADALGMHLDMFQRVMVAPASVSVVCYSPTGPRVLEANWTAPRKRATD